MTENSQDVWKNEYPYLSSVKDFDKNNPKFRWQKKFLKFCLICILFFCFLQSETVFAFKEPVIRVLIADNKNIRIRSDRSIPLIIDGEIFLNKKIKGLTLKNEENRKILYFDKNKQKKYELKSNQQFQVRSSDSLSLIHV